MDGDGEDAGVVPEDPLDAVAVVDVDVDVGDALDSLVEEVLDADGRVVVDAEPRGMGGHGVVHAAAVVDAVVDLAGVEGAGQGQGPTDDPRGGLVHARERRVVLGAQAASRVGPVGIGRGDLHGLDVGRVVDRAELLVGGDLGTDDLDVVEDAQGARQPRGEVEPDGSHRVLATEVVCREGVIPDEARPWAHAQNATPRG